MSIYKVERRVDTVIIEMDIDVAEKLTAVLGKVIDNSFTRFIGGSRPIYDLYSRLVNDAEVRAPSPLYRVSVDENYTLPNNPAILIEDVRRQ